MGSDNGDFFEQFAILTPRFIIVPTTTAISFKSYRALYSELHANVDFCQMGFGHHFPARTWNDDETRDWMQTRDIERCWQKRSLGDFAVGLRGPSTFDSDIQTPQNGDFTLLKGDDYARVAGLNNIHLAASEWVGYAGVRDATTTSMPPREPGDPALPSWVEMIELRYGVSPKFWGQGIVQEASKAVMQWSVDERGVKRFIAETERENSRSAKVLQKLGFTPSDTNYWKEPTELEWECAAK
ncbi:Acyl-CoA N-acyltransferase [Penicillium concentricum]|uniref:Acyl-CoA N-acyltransferase n=1 Tax=Penicillium concentricum TaxID=293559 RepID=A0A9W9RSB9_9EURO|nr:Acyl-CoA N-acyltransferase [Penicillium concentricum]KAJ5365527.1 Acyl-CoA N-acyltransferase [Penicillium concentricum]